MHDLRLILLDPLHQQGQTFLQHLAVSLHLHVQAEGSISTVCVKQQVMHGRVHASDMGSTAS